MTLVLGEGAPMERPACGLRLAHIRWKPNATEQDKRFCLWIGAQVNVFLDGFRKDGSPAMNTMRVNSWMVWGESWPPDEPTMQALKALVARVGVERPA